MIEQDLLGISVNDLIENYCVLYNKIDDKQIGITTIVIAEKIDKTYGNKYEEKYVFLDIFATDFETIKLNKILSSYEVQKVLEEYIGYVPDVEHIDMLASLIHAQWIESSKNAASLLIQLIKILKQYETVLNDDDINIITNIQSQIDNWRKQWCHYQMINDTVLKEEHIKEATRILEKINEKEII